MTCKTTLEKVILLILIHFFIYAVVITTNILNSKKYIKMIITEDKKNRRGSDWEIEILDYLKEHPNGCTIKEIADPVEEGGIGTTRITVSKYINGLVLKNQVYSKKVGVYNLYYSVERQTIPIKLVRTYYLGVLTGLKENFIDEDDPAELKEFGHIIAETILMNVDEQFPESVKKELKSFIDFLNYFPSIYPELDFLYDKNWIIEKEINEGESKANYELQNVSILAISDVYSLHFYIMAGLLEKVISIGLNFEIICDILDIDSENETVKFSIDNRYSIRNTFNFSPDR